MRIFLAVLSSFLIAAFAVIIGPFLVIIDWSGPPSDEVMISHFRTERTSFEELTRAALAISEFELNDKGIPADIRSLMEITGIRHVWHSRTTGETVLLYDSVWFAGDGWAKMYVHAPDPTSYWRVVPDLDEAYGSQALKPLMVERSIADGWAIRLDYSP